MADLEKFDNAAVGLEALLQQKQRAHLARAQKWTTTELVAWISGLEDGKFISIIEEVRASGVDGEEIELAVDATSLKNAWGVKNIRTCRALWPHVKRLKGAQLEGKVAVWAPEVKKVAPPKEPEATCCVCFVAEPSHAVIPCGHQCLCGPCGQQLRNCPICRGPIKGLMQVFK